MGWSLQDPYPIPILDNAVVAHGNFLYSFGGVSRNSVTTQSYRFDGSAWQAIAPLPAPREYSSAVSDGTYIYLLGGLDAFGTRTTSVYRYNPQTNTYRTLSSFAKARLAPGAVFMSGKIYLVAGMTGAPAVPSEVYTIATNNWTQVSPYPLAVGFVSVVADGGYVYSVGGVDGPNVATVKAYRYDPQTNVWDDAALDDLPKSRWGAAGALYRDDWLVAGGYVDGSTADSISATALTYDFETGQWTTITSMQQGRARMSGGSMGIEFFSVGGRSPDDTFMGNTSNQRFIAGCPSSLAPTATKMTATPTTRNGESSPTPTGIVPTTGPTPNVPARVFLPLLQH